MPRTQCRNATVLLASLLVICARADSVPAAETDLAKAIPGPSVFYLGWTGADACKQAFERTAFGQMLAEPEFAKLCEALGPQIEALVKAHLGGEGGADVQKPLQEVLRMLWRRPGAINVMRLMLMKTGVEIEAAAVWHMGDQAETFDKLVQPLLAAAFDGQEGEDSPVKPTKIGTFTLSQYKLGGGLPDLTWGRVGEYYILTAGSKTPQKVIDSLTGQSEREPLAKNADFAAARKRLITEGNQLAVYWHVSIKEIVRRLPLVFTVMELQQAKASRGKKKGRLPLGILVSRAIRALELRKFNSLAGSVSMQEDGYRIAWYLHAPGARSGLIKFFRQKSVTEQDLAVVPREASCFYATNFDLHGFYKEMMAAFAEVDPNMHKAYQDKLAECEEQAGVKLVDDLLAPLDDGWVLHTGPSDEGLLGTGFAILVETKDAARVERAVTALAKFAIGECGCQGVTLTASKTDGGKTIHVVEAECFKPWQGFALTWGSAGRYLVIGLDKQIAAATMKRVGADAGALKSDSILQRPDFASRRRLLPGQANAVGYLDAKEILGGLYRAALPMVPEATDGLKDAGIDLDASLMPKPETIERHLFGMVTALAIDAEGVLMISHAPLPLPTPTARSAAVVLGTAAAMCGKSTTEPTTATAPGE